MERSLRTGAELEHREGAAGMVAGAVTARLKKKKDIQILIGSMNGSENRLFTKLFVSCQYKYLSLTFFSEFFFISNSKFQHKN